MFRPLQSWNFILTLLVAIVLLPSAAVQAAELAFNHGWIRAMPPGANMSAAYGVLINTGKTDQTLVKVAVEGFSKAEIHRSTTHQGMVHMVPQPNLTVPAGQEVALTPGGYHMMLMEPQTAFAPGQSRSLTLTFADGQTISVQVPVQTGPSGGMDHGTMDHGTMNHEMGGNHKPDAMIHGH